MAKKQIRWSLYRARRRTHLMSWAVQILRWCGYQHLQGPQKAKNPERSCHSMPFHTISCHFIPIILCKIPAINHCRSLETRHVLLQISELLQYQVRMIFHGFIIFHTFIYCLHVSLRFCKACHSNPIWFRWITSAQHNYHVIACHSMR